MVNFSKNRTVLPCFNFCAYKWLIIFQQIVAMNKIYDLIQRHIRYIKMTLVRMVENNIRDCPYIEH